jgi:hypothetical protein
VMVNSVPEELLRAAREGNPLCSDGGLGKVDSPIDYNIDSTYVKANQPVVGHCARTGSFLPGALLARTNPTSAKLDFHGLIIWKTACRSSGDSLTSEFRFNNIVKHTFIFSPLAFLQRVREVVELTWLGSTV